MQRRYHSDHKHRLPGDPAYSIAFSCTTEGINGTIDFDSFRFYYTIQGPSGWTVEIWAVGEGGPSTRITKAANRVYTILGGTSREIAIYEFSQGFDPATISIRTGTRTYQFAITTPLGTPTDARATVPFIMNTMNAPITTLASPAPVLFSSSRYIKSSYESFIPKIDISAVSAAEDLNFGEAFYVVVDTVRHKGTVSCKNKRIVDSTAPGGVVYESKFSQFPQINSVLKGEGCSLRQKFRSLIAHYDLDVSIESFTAHMALYALLKYILARLMYGDFSLKYLDRCFNKQFMRDLSESHYSFYLFFFTNREIGLIGFDRYFKCLCEKSEEEC